MDRAGPYDRPVEECPFCHWPSQKWWPQLWLSLGQSRRSCHLKCAEEALQGEQDAFARSVCELLRRVEPSIYGRRPNLRIGAEEERMRRGGLEGKAPAWPYEPQALPEAVFAVAGLLELRISCFPKLTELPRQLYFQHLETLSLISNSLCSLPKDFSGLTELCHLYLNGNFLRSLPTSVCALPKLQEICLDANRLEETPTITSQQLKLFTAPGNELPELYFYPHWDRLEVHGNRLSKLVAMQPDVSKLVTLKVMGNQLTELPEVDGMPLLRILSVSQNRLRALPKAVGELKGLEWLLAYQNCITELPANLGPGNPQLTRLLLEANPLTSNAVAQIVAEVPRSNIRTLGLDLDQVAGAALPRDPLPAAVSVGSVIQVPGCSQISLKLTRASQLRRTGNLRAFGEKDSQDSASPSLLLVAFAASQAEPEWLGFLRRLLEQKEVRIFGEDWPQVLDTEDSNFDRRMSRLWSHCPVKSNGKSGVEVTNGASITLDDFDVLTAVDHRMRWYSEDRESLEQTLRQLRPKYRKVLFVGASMGGFGALLHGHMADGVLAFNPQAMLTEALLRPSVETPKALEDLSAAVVDSVRRGLQQGAQITVHCAADDHLMHAISLPGVSLVVHPLQPRKPFARILDRAGLLTPIVSDAIFRLLTGESRKTPVMGCWCRTVGLRYVEVQPGQLLRLFFHGSGMIPRPGDWFCSACSSRNCRDRFFCWGCSGPITAPGTTKVLDGFNYPGRWDWGCDRCGAAMCGYETSCNNCGYQPGYQPGRGLVEVA